MAYETPEPIGVATKLSLTGTLVKVVIDTVQVALAEMAVGYVPDCTRQNQSWT